MYNKTIIRFGFCDIQNNQGLDKGYQPQPSASADNPYLDLDYSGLSQKPHPIIVYKHEKICVEDVLNFTNSELTSCARLISGDFR